MPKILGREVSFWIGLIVTIVLGIVTTLAGEGLISDVAAGRVTDGVNAVAQLLTLVAPLIAALLIRQNVTPVAQPKLEVGTPVLVETPPGTPADTPPPDAVVALRSDLKPVG